jgi:hypothetical protein
MRATIAPYVAMTMGFCAGLQTTPQPLKQVRARLMILFLHHSNLLSFDG